MGPALAGLNGPVDGALGGMSVLPGSKPTGQDSYLFARDFLEQSSLRRSTVQ